ncbi:MAG: hypothetical protein U0520_03935 [Candidatus Saccharimonadales bacterium]
MVLRLIPVLIFAAIAVVIIQLINRSFTYTYSTVKTSLEAQYGKAQHIYDQEVSAYEKGY